MESERADSNSLRSGSGAEILTLEFGGKRDVAPLGESELRHAGPTQESWLHSGSGSFPWTWNRREYGNIHAH